MIKKGAKIASVATLLFGAIGIYLMYLMIDALLGYIKDE